jgi:ankyrin repeat protein
MYARLLATYLTLLLLRQTPPSHEARYSKADRLSVIAYDALSDGRTTAFKRAIEAGADVEARFNDGDQLIICASLKGNKAAVQTLIKHHAKVNVRDMWGNTPLTEAACVNRLDIVNLLLAAGSTVNNVNVRGHTAVQYAVEKGNVTMAKQLLGHPTFRPRLPTDMGQLLHISALKGHLSMTKLLLSFPYGHAYRDEQGNSALHIAAQSGHPRTCRALLMAGYSPQDRNKRGRTPMDLASRNGHGKTLKVLASMRRPW